MSQILALPLLYSTFFVAQNFQYLLVYLKRSKRNEENDTKQEVTNQSAREEVSTSGRHAP